MTVLPKIYKSNSFKNNIYNINNSINSINSLTIPCQPVTALPSANIFATNITITPAQCTEPCSLNIDVTYTNNGGATGPFMPTLSIDGSSTSLPSENLDPGSFVTKTFVITNIMKGSHIICVVPLGNTTCQTFNVSPPVAESGLPLLLGAGLLFGLLLQKKRCEDYKTREECPSDECQWKKNKCIPYNQEDIFLIKKLREKGAVGIPDCLGEQCRIGKWVAIAGPKGQPPIIIHDP